MAVVLVDALAAAAAVVLVDVLLAELVVYFHGRIPLFPHLFASGTPHRPIVFSLPSII